MHNTTSKPQEKKNSPIFFLRSDPFRNPLHFRSSFFVFKLISALGKESGNLSHSSVGRKYFIHAFSIVAHVLLLSLPLFMGYYLPAFLTATALSIVFFCHPWPLYLGRHIKVYFSSSNLILEFIHFRKETKKSVKCFLSILYLKIHKTINTVQSNDTYTWLRWT